MSSAGIIIVAGHSAFWKAYWEFAERIAPRLAMPYPKAGIPRTSHFIRFLPATLPSSVTLFHKVGHGHVDLQFVGMGQGLAKMERLYLKSLIPPMRIERAEKSAVIRIRVEPVDMSCTSFAHCKAKMGRGLRAAVSLLNWYERISNND